MRLGIFGDSYADVNGDKSLSAWPNLLAKKSNFCVIKALCGVSHYWTYERFLENTEHNNFTHIIFCHTNNNRWPCLPKEIEGSNWNIHNMDRPGFPDYLRTINKYYFDIFPENFTRFISKSIFENVNKYCKDNNIYLINLTSFGNVINYQSDFPILNDLDQISHQEYITYKNIRYQYSEFIKKHHLHHGDPRICHMGDLNNKRLADIITNLINSKQLNVEYNLYKEFEWDTDDISNDILFTTTWEDQLEAYNNNRL